MRCLASCCFSCGHTHRPGSRFGFPAFSCFKFNFNLISTTEMVDQNDDGGSAAGKTYMHSGQSYTPLQWYQQLKHMRDRRGAAAWWASFQPVLRELQGVDECFIECTLFKKLLSASNPSQRAKSHLRLVGPQRQEGVPAHRGGRYAPALLSRD